jgi:hypothetical protein
MSYRIVHDGHGMGNFLCPPGHPNHTYIVRSGCGTNASCYAVDYAITAPGIPDGIREQARQLIADAPITTPEEWVHEVYAYFRYNYSPDGTDRNISHAVSTSKRYCLCGAEFWTSASLDAHLPKPFPAKPDHYEIVKPLPPVKHHLGYLTVRDYIPDHQPRTDLF